MAKKADVEQDAKRAAVGSFNPTDEAFVGEKVRTWIDDPEQLSVDVDALAKEAVDNWGYRYTNRTFRDEFKRQFEMELRKFYNNLPDVREEHAIRDVKWAVECAISQGDDVAKKLAEKLNVDDAGHALEWSTGSVTAIAEGDVGRQVKKLLDRVGENLDDGRTRGFEWLADAIVRIAIQEAARISHGSNEMNFLVEFYRVKAWANFARNVQTRIAINRNVDEQS